MMAALVPRPTHRRQPTRARSVRTAWLSTPALVLLSACYGGDFFERLVDPDVVAAFRITNLTLIDPHFYSGDAALCVDSTSAYNQIWNDHLEAFEINPTIVLSPLDPAVETATKMQIVPATCISADTPEGKAVNCTDVNTPDTEIVEVVFNNSLQGGMCGGPVMGSLNPKYDIDQFEALNIPASPCFLSALIPTLKLPLGPIFKLPLSNVQISAAYALEPEDDQQLVEGLIVGFLPTEVGSSTMLGSLNNMPFTPWTVIAGATGCQPTPADPIDDVDSVSVSHDGVWIYFNFTAERVAWSTKADAMTDPPG